MISRDRSRATGPYARPSVKHDADWLTVILVDYWRLLVASGFLVAALVIGVLLGRLENQGRQELRDFQAAEHRMESAH
jgi:hypothetical protein